jgi:hypothetical protein
MEVNYRCKENDVKLKFHCIDNEIDEIWIQVEGEKSWTVIGYKDLMNGISKAQKKCKGKTSHDFGGGYIGEALLCNHRKDEK